MTLPESGELGDLPATAMRAYLHRMADWIADYRENIEHLKITPDVVPGDVSSLTAAEMPATGEAMGDILDDLDRVVMPGILHWGHPAFLGYFGSTSNGPALLGEMAAAALNVSAMTWKTSPAATELETVVLRWLRSLVALPEAFTGIVYDTASISTLHALAAARERAVGNTRTRGTLGRADVRPLRVYASTETHSSIERAVVMLGLGETSVVRVACDAMGSMNVDALSRAIEADVQRDLMPMAVVATIGTTSTGSVDAVRAIAGICSQHGLWLHVDAAYGGAAAAVPEWRSTVDGWELADSIVINPHKWLFVPLDFSVLYTRHPEVLRKLFASRPDYLVGDAGIDGDEGGAVVDYMDYGIQLGRRFRALKAWMVFRAFGQNGIADRLREHRRLALLLAQWIRESDGFEIAMTPGMSIVCFRAVRAGLDDESLDRLNVELVERLNDVGASYMTHTRVHGRTCIRVGFGNVSTTETHLRKAWDSLCAIHADLRES